MLPQLSLASARQGFSGVSLSPCSPARDAPALGCSLATAHPVARAALPVPVRGTTSRGGGEGGLGSWTTIPTRPWHGCAQHTKGRVNLVPPLQLRGWQEEKRRHTQGWLPWASPSPMVLGELQLRHRQNGGVWVLFLASGRRCPGGEVHDDNPDD